MIDLLFPPRCGGCDRPGTLLCEACRAELSLIDAAEACPLCGAPDGRLRCVECRGRAFAFSASRCAALLQPPASRIIVVLKDGGERRYARVLADVLATVAGDWLRAEDVLVPVPASPAALRRRGFDHALDLARALVACVGRPVAPVMRCVPTADQRNLGRDERFANRSDAFRLVARPPSGRLVLVDDVFTTGATMHAAATALRMEGAEEVVALAVARACTVPTDRR